MIASQFSHVDAWVFDLDNTLYPPHMRLFDQIQVRMTDWITSILGLGTAEADQLRQQYWQTYGTTLAGLMAEHGMDPVPYMTYVHDISFDALAPDPELRAQIKDLPGRRIIYTNGSESYAEKVISARGLSDVFDKIYGVEHANYRPKPEAAAFQAIFTIDGLDPKTAAMFEDDTRNLAAPFEMGMRTIHVAPAPEPADHIHHHTADLSGFLKQVHG